MKCERNIAFGAEYRQCCCPYCNSLNIHLAPIITPFSSWEMSCEDCGEFWDGDAIGHCVCDEEKEGHVDIMTLSHHLKIGVSEP